MIGIRCLLTVITLGLSFSLKGQPQRDSVLDRTVSLHAERKTAVEILEQISRENSIYFSYDASLVRSDEPVSLHLEGIPLRELLARLFGGHPFRFTGKENHIIISANEGEEVPPEEPVLIPVAETFTGTVVDGVTGDPLRDVNISLSGHAIGTITNAEGGFVLKLPPAPGPDSLLFSILGYGRLLQELPAAGGHVMIRLYPVSIRIREVKVRAMPVDELLTALRSAIPANYSTGFRLLTGFYRETLRQDDEYIGVSEAVVEILKAPYNDDVREDKVRLLKARRSPDVHPFHWVNFKLQGGPHTITLLDAVKNMETFLDPGYEMFYRYSIDRVIWYKNHPVYVVRFRPVRDIDLPCFTGEFYVDRESFALLYARFSLNPYGLALAEQSLIRKKPKGFKVKPQFVDYEVDFAEYKGSWHLHKANASVAFRVRNPRENVNSLFHSVSALLVTDVDSTFLKRFPVKDLFSINDIFSEMDIGYDEAFWGNYNIIKPDEDLQNAIRRILPGEEP